MNTISNRHSDFIESFFSIAVLFVLLIFTFGILVAVPYSGFYFNPINGQIEGVFANDEALLKTGDIIEQIGDISFTQIKADRRLVVFQETIREEVIPIKVIRDGEPITVSWVFPGFTFQEFSNRLFNSWILGYTFWLAGFTAQLSIRPRDTRRRLFIAANYLIAIFLVSGNLSSTHLWESSAFLHLTAWLMMPVFLQLHWEFPRPLGKTSKLFWGAFYAIASLLALAELVHVLQRNLYVGGFLVALIGSIILLLAHFFIHKDERQTVALLLFSIFIAFSFSVATALALAFGVVLSLGWFTIFSMPFMPLAYFYLINRRQLGGMEARVNRLLSAYAFLIFLGITLFAVVISILQTDIAREFWAFIAMSSAFIASLVTIRYLPRFQAFVDQRLFGITLPYKNLPETYSSRIATCENLPSLLTLLENEVFPSLLIRQYAFLQAQGKSLHPLLAKGIPSDPFDFDSLSQNAGIYLPNLSPQDGWTRLILPLKVGDATLGFWLLGKRDPDDLYPQVEIPILKSLTDQTAIALSNIIQTDQLREFYQADIESVESERRRISRGLHDDVLNELAAMRNSLDPKTLTPAFHETYEKIKLRVRETINDLRPSTLDHGLAHALQEYLEDLREKYPSINIRLNIQAAEERIPEKMEEHLYNIVREACTNALRHANPKTLTVSGEISPDKVDLSIQDDGTGFDSNTDLNALIADRHYGMANMKERALIIRAEMEIKSTKESGTLIQLHWRP
jgi:signal transduction histidine kinase